MYNVRPPYPNELYHYGVMGMHWGIRRYQPYRKGDRPTGGKEIGQATKVKQVSIADRVKKGIAAVNKIKKEMHKGNEEKAEYKLRMSQLKAAKKEVKKAQRREAEERIRERIREHREEERMERRENEERRERNWQRARDIANDAVQIGGLLYGAYQLKKSLNGAGALGNHGSQNAPSTPITSTSATPTSSSGHGHSTHPTLTSYTPPGASSNPIHIHTSGAHTAPSSLPTINRSPTTQSHAGPTHTLSPGSYWNTNPNPLRISTSGGTQPHAGSTTPLRMNRGGSGPRTGPADTTSTDLARRFGRRGANPTIQLRNMSRSEVEAATNATNANLEAYRRSRMDPASRAIYDARQRRAATRAAERATTQHIRSNQESLDRQSARMADANVNVMTAINKLRSKGNNMSTEDRNALRSLESLQNRVDRDSRTMADYGADLAQVRMQRNKNGNRIGASTRDADYNSVLDNSIQRGVKKVKRFKNLMTSTDASQRAELERHNDQFMDEMRRMTSNASRARSIDMNQINLLADASPDELIRRFRHFDQNSDELYHHGVMGMHWGIRRYQPYRKGERVRGGREVGQATKVEQRDGEYKQSIMSKLLSITNKTERDWAKEVKADKKRQKEGFYDSETPEYKDEYDRVIKGGVSKSVDLAAKKLHDAEDQYYKNPTDKGYIDKGEAYNKWVDAVNKHMEKSGIPRYNDKWLNDRISNASNDLNKVQSDLDNFDKKHGDKTSWDYYNKHVAGRSLERDKKGEYVDKVRREHEQLKRERTRLEHEVNKYKHVLDVWEEERKKNGSVKNARAQNDSKNFLVKHGIPAKVASKVVAGKSLDELADMMKDAYKDPSLLRTAKNMTPDELERHLYG